MARGTMTVKELQERLEESGGDVEYFLGLQWCIANDRRPFECGSGEMVWGHPNNPSYRTGQGWDDAILPKEMSEKLDIPMLKGTYWHYYPGTVAALKAIGKLVLTGEAITLESL